MVIAAVCARPARRSSTPPKAWSASSPAPADGRADDHARHGDAHLRPGAARPRGRAPGRPTPSSRCALLEALDDAGRARRSRARSRPASRRALAGPARARRARRRAARCCSTRRTTRPARARWPPALRRRAGPTGRRSCSPPSADKDVAGDDRARSRRSSATSSSPRSPTRARSPPTRSRPGPRRARRAARPRRARPRRGPTAAALDDGAGALARDDRRRRIDLPARRGATRSSAGRDPFDGRRRLRRRVRASMAVLMPQAAILRASCPVASRRSLVARARRAPSVAHRRRRAPALGPAPAHAGRAGGHRHAASAPPRRQERLGPHHFRYSGAVEIELVAQGIRFSADVADYYDDQHRLIAVGQRGVRHRRRAASRPTRPTSTRRRAPARSSTPSARRRSASKVDKSFFGTQEPDAFFYGETIEKIGVDRYRITQGRLHDLRPADAALGGRRRHGHADARQARRAQERRPQGQGRAAVLPAGDVLPDQQGGPLDRLPAAGLRHVDASAARRSATPSSGRSTAART